MMYKTLRTAKPKVLMAASVASMIDQFNMPNIRLLLEMGYEVHVACNFKQGNTCDKKRIHRLQNKLRRMQVKYYQWDCPRNVASFGKCLKAYRQLWLLTQRLHFAWMHCQSPAGGVLARIVAHQRGIPVVYTAHGFHFYRGAPLKNWMLYYPVEKLLAHWTKLLVTVNKEDYCFAKAHLAAEQVVSIPGVGAKAGQTGLRQANDVRKALRDRYGIAQDAVLLLSVGELNKGKNHRTAIAALAALKRRDLYYIICGQGRQLERLRRYANRLGVGDYVLLAGYQEQVSLFYQSADIFVFPSMREGMPVALMEAMAAGMPCVVSDIRGNRELVGQASLRFSPKNGKQLCRILERLLANPGQMQAYGRYNQKKVSGYRIDVVQKRMHSIYAKMNAVCPTMPIKNVVCPAASTMNAVCPAVSILIAVYQPDFVWLRELLVSILRQRFQDFEVLLMDDGSGQAVFWKTCELAKEVFGTKYKVKLLQSVDNEGSDRTFEKLAGVAAGKYLAFCDQDDIWEPDKLELLVKTLRKTSAKLVYSDMSVIDANGKKIYKSLRRMRRCLRFASGGGLTARYIMDNCTAACSMLVCREMVQRAMPFYKGAFCDQWIAACSAAYGKIVFVDKPLVRYRRHGKNQTGTLYGIRTRQDYIQKRILPACGFVQELKRRGIHYPREREIQTFVLARKQGNAAAIFRYRKCSRKYAYFDLLMLWLPDAVIEPILTRLHKE